jgi:tetratricopeptide (TPR) repeat protein
MRHAVVLAPPRFVLPAVGSVFAASEPVGPICATLARGGRRLLLVQTTPDLLTDFEAALAEVDRGDDLLVYIAAATTTTTEAVALRLGSELDATGEGAGQAVPLQFLSDAVLARQPSAVLFVVEACHDGDPDDPMLAAEHVDAILRTLDARALGYGALVGVRAESRASASDWPFTRCLVATLADPGSRDEYGAARASLVYDRLRTEGAITAHVQSFAFVQAETDVVIVEGGTLPPDARAEARTSAHSEAPPETSDQDATPATTPVEPAPPEATSPEATSSEPEASETGLPGASMAERPRETPDSQPPPAEALAWEPPPEAPFSEAPSETRSQALSEAPSQAPSEAPSESAPEIALPASPSLTELPEPRATEPSLPAIEPLIDLADDAFERGALTEALAGYKAALMVAPPSDALGRAAIYARIGELKRAQGKSREAELNFEKAVANDPSQKAALTALVELATESKEVHRAIDLRRTRLRALTVPDERVAELRAIADAYADQLHEPRAAAETLDQALAVDGKSRSALEGLRAAFEKLQRWSRLLEVLSQLAETADGAAERGALRFAAADIALGRVRDEARGLALLEQALDDDPTHDGALRALLAVRTSRGEWKPIEAAYSRLAGRLVGMGDTERAWDVCRKLGVLRRDKLNDVDGAVEALTAATRLKPSDVEGRALLAETHLAAGHEPDAVTEFERIARDAPLRSSTYARLFALHRRAGRTDRAWLAGGALEELAAADMDQQLFVDQYRPDGPIRPTRSLDGAAWDELLRAPGADDVVADVLRAIVSTAVAARIEELRQARKLVTPDPARRQSATSTVSIVRSFYWAAQVLDVEPPDLYVMDDVPGGIAAIQAAVPATALGSDVLRGLTAKELAFLAGRHLTYYRPEHYCLICYPTLNDLSALFLGAVKIALPDLEAPAHLRDAVARTRKVLARQATDDEKRRLRAAVDRLEARDGRVDLAAWIRNVELTAQRAGLLLCGDLSVGTSRLRAEAETRAIAELAFDEKRGDLLAYCASDKLARARLLLGVDAHASVSSPPAGQLQAG